MTLASPNRGANLSTRQETSRGDWGAHPLAKGGRKDGAFLLLFVSNGGVQLHFFRDAHFRYMLRNYQFGLGCGYHLLHRNAWCDLAQHKALLGRFDYRKISHDETD